MDNPVIKFVFFAFAIFIVAVIGVIVSVAVGVLLGVITDYMFPALFPSVFNATATQILPVATLLGAVLRQTVVGYTADTGK